MVSHPEVTRNCGQSPKRAGVKRHYAGPGAPVTAGGVRQGGCYPIPVGVKHPPPR